MCWRYDCLCWRKGNGFKGNQCGQRLERENQTTKINWRHIKIFSKTAMPISIKLDTTHLFCEGYSRFYE